MKLDFMKEYQKWIDFDSLERDFKSELESVKNDKAKIQDMFYKHLDFGTGGLRGIMGAGINRMNVYTVRRVTQGIAEYLNQKPEGRKKLAVIAYDSRNMSKKFAEETAKVFAGHGISVCIFDDVRSTPELSFTIKYLEANCGVIITASHNPPMYNGYKVYNSNGAQLSPEASKKVLEFINNDNLDIFIDIISVDSMSNSLIEVIGSEIDEKYYEALSKYQIQKDLTQNNGQDLSIVYTPLHGVGYKAVKTVMDRAGFTNFYVVESQKDPDGNFPTVSYPNPEDKACFKLALELAEQKNADLIIANDPDADRLGIAIRNNNKFEFLSGNQVGILLCNYLISQMIQQNSMPENSFVVSTVVTTRMVNEICKLNNVEYYDTYTGFKNICGKSTQLEEIGKHFIFGFEESYGYLTGNHACDKDGIQSALLISQMVLYYKKNHNQNLIQVLENLYSEYGYYYEDQLCITKEGISGADEINKIMELLRNSRIENFGDFKVEFFRDYLKSEIINTSSGEKFKIDMPAENLLYFELSHGLEFAVRPSGTEPKIKFYLFSKSDSLEKSKDLSLRLKNSLEKLV